METAAKVKRRLSKQLAAVIYSQDADQTIKAALAVLEQRQRYGSELTSPSATRDYLRLTLAGLEHEQFWAVFMDSQHRVIECRELFRGSLAQTSVYPREVVKAALACNAGAVIFAHNHPSGVSQPSRSDELLTRSLRDALSLVDVRVLDHFVVAGDKIMSFAERGLL